MVTISHNRTQMTPSRTVFAAIMAATAIVSVFPAKKTLISETKSPKMAAQKTKISFEELTLKADQQCAAALADHRNGLAPLERDPMRREYRLKKIVLAKNREWKQKAPKVTGFVEFFVKSNPFSTYKSNLDRHVRALNQTKKKLNRHFSDRASLTIANIEKTQQTLAMVKDCVMEHDCYLHEKVASGTPGGFAVSMAFKFIPSPFKFLA